MQSDDTTGGAPTAWRRGAGALHRASSWG